MTAVGTSADLFAVIFKFVVEMSENTITEPGQEIKGGLVGEEMTVSRAIRGILRLSFLSVFLSFCCLFELGQDPEIKGGLVGDEMTMEASRTYPANSSEWTEMKLISVLDFPKNFYKSKGGQIFG